MTLEDYLDTYGGPLPTVEDDRELVVDSASSPEPPRELRAPGLAATITTHVYAPAFAIPSVHLHAERRTYRALGLLILGQLFHRGPRTILLELAPPGDLELTGTGSQVAERLILGLPAVLEPNNPPAGLALSATAFTWWPSYRRRHPFLDEHEPVEPRQLPWVNITGPDGTDVPRRNEAPAIAGFGSLAGTVAMAQLLLDIAQPTADGDEYDLECEGGFRGVAPQSHEIRLNLPGAFAWVPHRRASGG